MSSEDLNLLPVLDALLQEGSVTGAARRLHLTAPAVSRSLGRLRGLIGDPLFVRAGRNLVPTAVAERLRDPVHDALATVHQVLAPARVPSDHELEDGMSRVFRLHMGPDNASGFGPALLAAVRRRAPAVQLEFTGDGDDPTAALRDRVVDLVVGGPPIRVGVETLHREVLLTDPIVVVARRDGAFASAVSGPAPTPDDVAAQPHVNRSPRSAWHDEFDRGLAELELRRHVVATAPGFAAAFALVAHGDLVCLAPKRLTGPMLGDQLRSWPTPVDLPPLVVEQVWHHRSDTDPEHRWLRKRVREAVRITDQGL